METYDVIVLGLGGMGTAAAFELSRRGRRVLGIEQFAIGHDRGSSHGETRIIRKAYFEHPNYVPLLRRAYERWFDLEQRTGQRLMVECGVLSVGASDSEIVAGVMASARDHQLPVEILSADELRRSYPQYRIDDTWRGVLERDAGFLHVERCVDAHAQQARKNGADLHEHEEALGWRADERHVEVVTNRGRYAGANLVITAGAWATRLLCDVGVSYSIMRQVAAWFRPATPGEFRRDQFPCFIVDTPAGYFYGFPMIDSLGVKVARHYGAPELADPSAVDWELHGDDEASLRIFLQGHLPAADGPMTRGTVCMYTLTPDRHFVIDRHPRHANVVVAAGFSGHGFKFASVVGEILADLCDRGASLLPIGMFSATRFGKVGE
jgi:sarcosine oxidase